MSQPPIPPGQQPGQFPPQQPYATPNYQPPQYTQQNQYPQVGYFGGAPEPKKSMPWWGWALVVVVVIIVIGAIGAAIRPTGTTTTSPTSQAVVVTTAPVAAPTQRIIVPTATVVQAGASNPTQAITTHVVIPPTQRPIPTPLPSPTALPAAVGFVINGFHSLANVSSRTPDAANSVYFIVDFTITNTSGKPLLTSPLYFKIQNKQSFSYEYSDVTYLLPKGYKSTTLAPNETTRGEIAFEVPNGDVIVSGIYEDVFGNKVIKPIG